MFLGCSLDISWLITYSDPIHTIVVLYDSSELLLPICINCSDEIYVKQVLI